MIRIRLRIEPPSAEAFGGEYEGPSVVLGRSAAATIPIPDPSISRRHARLFERDGEWYVEDLGSRNATLLNGRALSAPTRLRPRDELLMAGTRVVVEDEAPSSDTGDADGWLSGLLKPAKARLDLRSLKLLNEVHRELARAITLEELLALILESAFRHLAPEEGAIFLKKPGGEIYRAAGRRAPGREGEFLYSRRLVQEVTGKGLAALVEDVSHDERFATSESMLGFGVSSLVAAPLLDAAGCAGMVVLDTRARRFTEEDLELLVSLASAAALRIHNIALAEGAAERRVLEKELALAHEIQMGMLPKPLPPRVDVEIAAELRPARSVGGDLYDFLLVGERLWLLVGDVSGKGVGAALFMAVTKTLFRAVASADASLATALARMNKELVRDNERAMFVTAFLACLDLATGELEYANAGHNLPYRLAGDGSLQAIDGGRGLPLGVLEERKEPTARLRLEPGDTLYLYTDGIVEALNPEGEEFTDRRLEECLGGVPRESPAKLVQETLGVLQAFVRDAPQSDDVTVLALRYTPPHA